MWTISEIKETGRAAFKANYWPCVLVAFLITLFTGSGAASGRASGNSTGSSSDLVNAFQSLSQSEQIAAVLAFVGILAGACALGLVVKIFLSNPIRLGGATFFKNNIETGSAPVSTVGTGFRNYWHNFVVLFLRDLYLILWFLLLIIPGFVKAYSYCMVPYILAENPDMSAREVITRSREMMDGNKWQAFLLDLSFIGWIFLSIVTLGLGLVFWTAPYMESTHAALYLKLKEETQYA